MNLGRKWKDSSSNICMLTPDFERIPLYFGIFEAIKNMQSKLKAFFYYLKNFAIVTTKN